MELQINSITNHADKIYVGDMEVVQEMPMYSVIDFSVSNNGKRADLKLKVLHDKLIKYNSVPDYEATAWEFLRDILKGLGT
ncbi:hypothetical protein J25TS5_04140 [Paenibacillus faecis]|uniref:hypothetical protein n=1 Tax=Paenibacillus faecis TaxID=862114 RepID=UPI001B1779C8|nr:hypothetical protein [Paenibacillus faecis]GIO83482.1 hypothetical protein J25TS5_04140 [Paenibacillus faecis]